MRWWPIGFALFAASLLPIHAACTAALNRALGRPPLVAMISLTGSLIFMLATGLLTGRLGLVSAERIANVPVWAWFAGVCGAIFVLSQPIVVPRLGAAFFTALAVTAQVTVALAVDHFGALNLPQHAVSPGRIAGVLLMVAGIVLVARS
jgi:bacterial/archaeal transporter family-2 protein